MTNFFQWLITLLAAIAAILIIFGLAAISVFAAGVLFLIIGLISIVSYFTGESVYATKFIYASSNRKERDYDEDKIEVDVSDNKAPTENNETKAEHKPLKKTASKKRSSSKKN